MLDPTLKSNIAKLWNKFWSGGISNPLTAIEQISYLIFMKRLEDEDTQRMNDALLNNSSHESIFKGHEKYKWSNWADDRAKNSLKLVRDEIFPFLKELGEEDSLYRKYMKDATFVIPTGALLSEAVKIINELHIKEQNLDTQGDIYEFILDELRTAGKNGQFRTPKHIRDMMVDIAQPKINERACDPACGTAGFLVSIMRHILEEHTSSTFIKVDEFGNKSNFKADKLSSKEWNKLLNDTLYGSEIDPTMIKISLMNLMMHGIKNPHISQRNSLTDCTKDKGKFDLILANPPFKGSIDVNEIKNKFSISTSKTELLFLELMYDLLAVGGRCAVIVPDGVLFGSSNAHRDIRKKLMDKCRLDAVISMPSGVFKPYAGVSTGVLFFTKGEPTENVWFYDMTADGFSLDDKRIFIDGKGDIPDIIGKFQKRYESDFTDRTAKCFFVPADEIRGNNYDLSISKYKEIKYEEVEYEPLDKLYQRWQTDEQTIRTKMESLKENFSGLFESQK
ncbi:type I restriction-modification system subunit M [Methanosarcina mazei]|uniref:site-specific DNA-methyltransferase (adenine-specific) n=1 Tax=Methanosarcina mazei SarPi TaxID=1434115 RepID=A0A0E3LSM2_METMZ|nr:class I SAM-dependent DNA methyltransferase [Methanosarcina mazei]AKB62016.1 Type I restriction-modification system, DNA-methyltransferase subunit M [Methanosarcina mazei SarPi]